jgi:hypothetical protein
MTVLNKNINVQDPSTIIRDLGLQDTLFRKIVNLGSDGAEFNRYHIESEDAFGYKNKFNKTVSKSFKLLQPSDIQEVVNILVENNEGLEVVTANCNNYGEKIDIQFQLPEEYTIISNVQGIGEVRPTLYSVFPVWGSVKFITATFQLFCSNQIPSLAGDPLNQFVILQHRKDILTQVKEQVLAFDNLHDLMKSQVEFLESLAKVEADDEDFHEFITQIFNLDKEKVAEGKSKKYKRLQEIYTDAPNAAPGTLLGCLNTITRYYAEKPYKKSIMLSNLPSSPSYLTTQSAVALCKQIERLGWEYLG